ncbi:MAG: hypothetical protein ACHQQ3_11695 [Gemmatimonadales bacterium]
MARVALACNPMRTEMLAGRPLDSIAELDTEETLLAVEAAIREGGHTVVRVEADAEVAERLRGSGADIVFNISEGVSRAGGIAGGESRESLVPAVCELIGMPYTGSGVLSTATCLDKPRTKQVLKWHDIPTPAFQVFEHGNESVSTGLRYPLIAKLAGEGSSMGLGADSIVDDERALRRAVSRLIETYHGRVLVEEFIQGREFTVGVLGNAPPEALPIVEVVFDEPRGINLFDPDDPIRVLAQEAGSVIPSGGGHRSVCPAQIREALAERIRERARRAFRALGCRDWCRIDFRMDLAEDVYLLELNPIAGIDPSYLLPRAAAAAGLTYAMFVNRILDSALERARRTS